MKIMLTSSVLVMLAVAMAGCSGGDTSIPKPTAFPRVAVFEKNYSAVDSLPLRFEVNNATTVKRPRPLWLNIEYQPYGATVFITLTQAGTSEIAGVLDNRHERMMLNVNDKATANSTKIDNGSFTSILIRSSETVATPLQFISTDRLKWVVSGTVFFNDVSPGASIDSLAPMVATIERDLLHALKTLDYSR